MWFLPNFDDLRKNPTKNFYFFSIKWKMMFKTKIFFCHFSTFFSIYDLKGIWNWSTFGEFLVFIEIHAEKFQQFIFLIKLRIYWYFCFKDAEEKLIKLIPMQRLGTAKEVANVVISLASDTFSYTTGQSIVIDGAVGFI